MVFVCVGVFEIYSLQLCREHLLSMLLVYESRVWNKDDP